MSSIKDKLTQSVRQARSSQPVKTAGTAARKTAEKSAPAVKSAPAPKAATRPAPKAAASRLASEPASSATTLFPQRVWPD
ncbi:hypothetical protein [Thiomonas intermedia]|uniref:hypothetical protein n=1 Tax=Thiomonas intermedia TaxID=926 RepID=UPI0009A4826F|nr:hypothetical protein [Thiomonas intermedia]